MIESGWYAAQWREGQRAVVLECIVPGDGVLCREDRPDAPWRMDRPLGVMVGPFDTRTHAQHEAARMNREEANA